MIVLLSFVSIFDAVDIGTVASHCKSVSCCSPCCCFVAVLVVLVSGTLLRLAPDLRRLLRHPLSPIMDVLKVREAMEPSFLEKSFGEKLKVPIFAFDDSQMMNRVECLWEPTRLHPCDKLIYTAAYDVYVYKDSESFEIARVAKKREILVSLHGLKLVDGVYMLDLEGGGSVPFEFVTPRTGCELNINPDLVVINLPVPRIQRTIRHRRAGGNVKFADSQFDDVCLNHAFRDHGVKVPYTRSGPFWILRDGNEMLLPFKLECKRVTQHALGTAGKYIVNVGGHFLPLRVIHDAHEKSIYIKRNGAWENVTLNSEASPFALLYSSVEPTRS